MSDDNIISMAEAADNALMQSPEQVLNAVLSKINTPSGKGAFRSTSKIIIIALDDFEDNYKVSFMQSGMRMSECNSLCDIAKSMFKEEMGY